VNVSRLSGVFFKSGKEKPRNSVEGGIIVLAPLLWVVSRALGGGETYATTEGGRGWERESVFPSLKHGLAAAAQWEGTVDRRKAPLCPPSPHSRRETSSSEPDRSSTTWAEGALTVGEGKTPTGGTCTRFFNEGETCRRTSAFVQRGRVSKRGVGGLFNLGNDMKKEHRASWGGPTIFRRGYFGPQAMSRVATAGFCPNVGENCFSGRTRTLPKDSSGKRWKTSGRGPLYWQSRKSVTLHVNSPHVRRCGGKHLGKGLGALSLDRLLKFITKN